MGLVVPNAIEIEVINQQLTPTLTLRLYGNNVTPNGASATANFTEIAGGGYANVVLPFASWSIISGDPSYGLNAVQNFIFTGPIDPPGTIFGYYITRNTDNALLLAEIFPLALVPFVPIAGSQIVILPKFSVQSQF